MSKRCRHEGARPLFERPSLDEQGAFFSWLLHHAINEDFWGCDACGAILRKSRAGNLRTTPRHFWEYKWEHAREWEAARRGVRIDDGHRRKIQRLEALIARPGTEGERAAAQVALDRLKGVAR